MSQTASTEDKAHAFDLMIKHQMCMITFGRNSLITADVVDDIGDKHHMHFSGSFNGRPITDVAIEVIRDAAKRLDGMKGE